MRTAPASYRHRFDPPRQSAAPWSTSRPLLRAVLTVPMMAGYPSEGCYDVDAFDPAVQDGPSVAKVRIEVQPPDNEDGIPWVRATVSDLNTDRVTVGASGLNIDLDFGLRSGVVKVTLLGIGDSPSKWIGNASFLGV